jgi:hypothetical protein
MKRSKNTPEVADGSGSLDRLVRHCWDRAMWAVEMSSPGSRPLIIGDAWAGVYAPKHEGQPTRCLLFVTREQARKWCKVQHDKYASRLEYDICRSWRFKPVRVREIISLPNAKVEARRK